MWCGTFWGYFKMRLISFFAIGLIFGMGIALSGMANPAKVLNFFDVAGNWDPSLVLVMISAWLVTVVGYFVVLKRPKPVWADVFNLPQAKQIDLPLIGGAATFGIGWGLTGYCPGGSIPALGLGLPEPFIFVAAMIGGIIFAKFLRSRGTFARVAKASQ